MTYERPRTYELFLTAAQVAVDLLGRPEVAQTWDSASALAGYRVAGLAGHLAGQVNVVRKVLHELRHGGPADGPPIPLLEQLAQSRWIDAPHDGPVHGRIRASGDDYAVVGAAELATATGRALIDLRQELPRVPGQTLVRFPWGPPTLTLDDLLLNRLMEIVVHVDDLATSADVDIAAMPTAVTDQVIEILALLSGRRRGPLAVIRALARPERAPGSIAAF